MFRKRTNKHEAELFVSALYRGALRREPDGRELEHYINAILNGRSHASIAQEFIRCEEFRSQARVNLFVPPGHFYSPIVDPLEAKQYLATKVAIPESLPGITTDRAEMVRTWCSLLPFLSTVPFPKTKAAQFRYAFDNPMYSWGDGSVLHAMLRFLRPKRLIEIGSGWSSACTLDTVDRYLSGACELTFIDPYHTSIRNLIGDTSAHVCVIQKPVQQVSLGIFEKLEAADILFIDSSHVLRTGSDVCFELFEILPRLAEGVFVHFHDMFWPFEYPQSWVIDENRSWNELYAVRAFLTNNRAWDIVLFNDYLAKFERRMIDDTFPQFLRNTGGALWLKRR